MKKIIAYDLGTGGIKASLFSEDGVPIASSFIQYETYFPNGKYVEQRPDDWWSGVCASTRVLLEKSGSAPSDICCAALSGHSLVVAPIAKNGELLTERTPIWSDTRAFAEAEDFFREIPYEKWYETTGNGDPPACYSVMKLKWLKANMPDVFTKTYKVLGSKDYVNYRFTGNIATDPSYASGFGVFNLLKWDYEEEFMRAAGIPRGIFPDIIPSSGIVGKITRRAAEETGLSEGTPIACGGVDNTCMALGARGIEENSVYTSLGSSSWIAVTSKKPVTDIKTLPFVFAHAQKGYYTSAVSIFSAGNSFRWVRDIICRHIPPDENAYDIMNEMAARVPCGSGGVMFNPTLCGGSSQEKSPDTCGGFMGLTLGTTTEQLVRASMEGVALALRRVLDILSQSVSLKGEMLICGGGSKSPLWRQIFADIYNMPVLKTNIDQDAASLGAAAMAAVGCGLWSDYSRIPSLHRKEDMCLPDAQNNGLYEELLKIYAGWSDALAEAGEKITALRLRRGI